MNNIKIPQLAPHHFGRFLVDPTVMGQFSEKKTQWETVKTASRVGTVKSEYLDQTKLFSGLETISHARLRS